MKKQTLLFLFATLLAFAMVGGCRPTPSPTITPATPTLTPPAPSPTPPGKTILVTNAADSGPGTLRQALLDAQSGDTITFDPTVFPPDAPETIAVTSGLSQISQGHLTIDASDAGVILDGSQLPGDSWMPGLEIVSDGNTIRGLQVINFTGTGIVVAFHGRNNTIGGDRNIGAGPIGQGNLSSGNDFGIGLWDFAANNIVTGNIVGTDASGGQDLGNRSSGMWIAEGGTDNVVGPDNVIAYNHGYGIVVEGSDSLGNTLTQNSIHDNGGAGIRLFQGGNATLGAPLPLDFDLTGGLISGSTCANCTVEIFSDSGDEGTAYEGQVVADSNGVFAFNKGVAFANTHITLSASDFAGNTSAFSTPTSGASMKLAIQDGNGLPRVGIVTKGLSELANNRIGDMFPLDPHPLPCPKWDEDWSFTHVRDLGLKWVRLSVDVMEYNQAQSMGLYSQSEINACQDEIVSGLAANDVTIMHVIVFWDETLHVGENYPRYQKEEEIQRYLDYARFIVRHFKGRIKYYEILNEPVNGPPQQHVELADYINLIRRVVPVIREEDPEAKIVVGGATDLRHAYSREYFFGVLRSDIMPLVDAIAAHPMYGASPQYDEIRQYYYDYPSLVQEMRDVASAHGFSGEYFAEEMSWRTSVNSNPYEPWEYTATVAAKYYARGIVMNLGMDVWAGVGGEMYDTIPPIVEVVQNLGTVMAGAKPEGSPVEIQSGAANIASYTFSLPDGDRLIALWIDGVAVDDDPGVPATLTFPGTSAQKAIGIDVLNGFEQELVTETENGNMVIRNLFIKDYPIILRFTARSK